MLFLGKAKEEFDITPVTSYATSDLVNRCINIYQGRPDWLTEEVKTVNYAKAICSEVARLTTLACHIEVDGADVVGSRAAYIDKQINSVFFQLRHWIEYGCGYGTVIIKPSLDVVEVMTPDRFIITEIKNDRIMGVVFHDQIQAPNGKKWYNRLEYHRFLENGLYAVDNRCYEGETKTDTGKQIPIEASPWCGIEAHVEIENIEQPLFGVFRTPAANNRDVNSPLGMPIFADAIEELRDLDIAYSMNAIEIERSKRIVLMDADKLTTGVNTIKGNSPSAWERKRNVMKLPDYVQNVEGDGTTSFYQEINPTLNTAVRVEGINSLLSQISFKCGFSNGYFVFNEKNGWATATQIEADQQRTIQLVKDMRDKLEDCIGQLAYALDKFADLYDLAPTGDYELRYDFGDITYSYEEDKAMWWNYVAQGKMPAWLYFTKFEGMTEDEAKGYINEAATSNAEVSQLFASVGSE